jgi:hypothetical protein
MRNRWFGSKVTFVAFMHLGERLACGSVRAEAFDAQQPKD